jgi:hypothetical protein
MKESNVKKIGQGNEIWTGILCRKKEKETKKIRNYENIRNEGEIKERERGKIRRE